MIDDQLKQPEAPAPASERFSLSREDQTAIHSLATELQASTERIAETYGRELTQLRKDARVMAFLPLVVSRIVRRRYLEERRSV